MTAGAFKNFGVLSIVFGALLGLSAAFSIKTELSPVDMPEVKGMTGNEQIVAATLADLKKMRDDLRPYTLSHSVANLLFGLSLLALGVALYQQRVAAIKAGIVWASLALVEIAGDTWVTATIVGPKMMAAQKQLMHEVTKAASMPSGDMINSFFEAGRWIMTLAGAFFSGLYPLILLIVLLRARTAPPPVSE